LRMLGASPKQSLGDASKRGASTLLITRWNGSYCFRIDIFVCFSKKMVAIYLLRVILY
jgi:hypothetical protein